MATIPFFRDFKIAAIPPFGIPVWLPSPFSGFQYGYRPLFWCLHTAISPFFGILKWLPSPFSAFEGKEKPDKTHTLGNAYDKVSLFSCWAKIMYLVLVSLVKVTMVQGPVIKMKVKEQL